MILLCGLRAYSDRFYHIGLDTYGYHESYVSSTEYRSLSEVILKSQKDVGYKILIYILSKHNVDFTVALILFSAVYIGIIGLYIYKYSRNIMVSLIVFAGLGLYTFAFSAIRQSIAMGLCVAAYMLDDKYKGVKGFIYFAFLVGIASTIHTSAVVFAPAYILGKLPYKGTIVLGLIMAAAVTMLFKIQFAKLIMRIGAETAEHYAGYDTEKLLVTERNAGTKLYLLVVAIVALRLFFANKFSSNARNNSLVYMMLFMLILFPATQGGGAIMRIYYYYYIFIVTFAPNVIEGLKDARERKIMYVLFIAFLLYFYHSLLTNRGLMITPYKFFWQ